MEKQKLFTRNNSKIIFLLFLLLTNFYFAQNKKLSSAEIKITEIQSIKYYYILVGKKQDSSDIKLLIEKDCLNTFNKNYLSSIEIGKKYVFYLFPLQRFKMDDGSFFILNYRNIDYKNKLKLKNGEDLFLILNAKDLFLME